MVNKVAQNAINAFKLYIEAKEQELKDITQKFLDQKQQWQDDKKRIDDEIKTSKSSIAALEKQLDTQNGEEKLPEIPSVEPPTPCPKCGRTRSKKTRVRKVKGENVQEWECLNCGQRFTTPLTDIHLTVEPSKRPGAGSKTGGGKGRRSGLMNKAVNYFLEQLKTGRCILIKEVMEELNVPESSTWRAAMKIKDEYPEYEYYKDTSKYRHPRGLRPRNPSNRKMFCPKCKSLLKPGENCKKCGGET